MPFLLLLTFINVCSAAHISAGFLKSLLDVQDKNGKEVQNPYDPMLGVGYNFRFSDTWGFSPQLAYVYDLKKSQDDYNDYSVQTFAILYDMVWLPFSSLRSGNVFAFRFGLGTFIRSIKGEGGTVEIPNGTSTATAYRPAKAQTSYSSTVNLGADFTLDTLKDYFENFGIRGETFIFRVLSKEYRTFALGISTVGYF